MGMNGLFVSLKKTFTMSNFIILRDVYSLETRIRIYEMNFNQRSSPAPEPPTNRTYNKKSSMESMMTLLTFLGLLMESETGSDEEVNDCDYEDVFDLLADDFVGEHNIFEYKLMASKMNQSCLCFKLGSFSLTLVCTERKLKNNLAEFRLDFKIVKLFRIKNHKKSYCYVIISKLVPYWLTQSMGTFIQGVLKTRVIQNEDASGIFIWARLVCLIRTVALLSNAPI